MAGPQEYIYDDIGDGRKIVTTAGTAVALATTTQCKRVKITALVGNTGVMAVGSDTVDAASGSERGIVLYPGDSVEIHITDLSKVYIDTTVNGEGVSYVYYK